MRTSVANSLERDMAAGLHAIPWMALPAVPPGTKLSATRAHVAARRVRLAPRAEVLAPANGAGPWALYFAFAPDGRALGQHRFTMTRLREQGFRILLVVACNGLPDANFMSADAVIRKELNGFDFSGYAIGLDHLADTVGRTDVLVLNDSVFGPFADMRTFFARTPFRMTGFTASYAVEPHLQSYAFLIRDFDRAYMEGLRPVMWRRFACSHHGGVAFLQETRLGRIAARMGSVGSVWTPSDPIYDLTMSDPLGLLAAGYPFLKRSVIGKFSDGFDSDAMIAALTARDHPIERTSYAA